MNNDNNDTSNPLNAHWWYVHAPLWAKYAAISDNGYWTWFENEPVISNIDSYGIKRYRAIYGYGKFDTDRNIDTRCLFNVIDNLLKQKWKTRNDIQDENMVKGNISKRVDVAKGDYSVSVDADGVEHWLSHDGRWQMDRFQDGNVSILEWDQTMNKIREYWSKIGRDNYWKYDDQKRMVWYKTNNEEGRVTHGFNYTQKIERNKNGVTSFEYRQHGDDITEDEYNEINDGSLFKDGYMINVNHVIYCLKEVR